VLAVLAERVAVVVARPRRPAMSDLLDVARRVAAMAGPGEEVEAYVVHRRDTDVRAYDGGIESLSAAEAQGIGIRVVTDLRQGFAFAGTLTDDVVAETLAEARDNAELSTPDEHAGLPAPDGVAPPPLDVWRGSLADVATEDKVALALELERAVRAGDPRIVGVRAADYGDVLAEMAVASSSGVAAESQWTACSLSVQALASDAGETQTGSGWSVGREVGDLDVAQAADRAVERATRMLGATKPPTARLTVVLDPAVTARFLGVLSAVLNGESVLKGRSFFAGRVGESVGAPIVTLVDDPTNPLAFTAAAVDAEGLASRRNVLLDGGVLRGFVHNTVTGRRSGDGSTGSAVRAGFKSVPSVGCRALALVPGDRDQEELLADVEDGVLVRSVSGLHSGVNPVSGDFSTGASGLRVRDGGLAEPVREFTIASTLQRMLQDVVAVGSDVDWLPGAAAGVSLVVRDVTVSGS
jgi:PmbA protein